MFSFCALVHVRSLSLCTAQQNNTSQQCETKNIFVCMFDIFVEGRKKNPHFVSCSARLLCKQCPCYETFNIFRIITKGHEPWEKITINKNPNRANINHNNNNYYFHRTLLKILIFFPLAFSWLMRFSTYLLHLTLCGSQLSASNTIGHKVLCTKIGIPYFYVTCYVTLTIIIVLFQLCYPFVNGAQVITRIP